jgi:hypothetical protein
MKKQPALGDLRVWWIPQVPMAAFHVPVASLREAKLILDTLARYDLFQLEHRVKPDFCNAGGLQVYEPGYPGGEWCEWSDEQTGYSIDDLSPADIAARCPA